MLAELSEPAILLVQSPHGRRQDRSRLVRSPANYSAVSSIAAFISPCPPRPPVMRCLRGPDFPSCAGCWPCAGLPAIAWRHPYLSTAGFQQLRLASAMMKRTRRRLRSRRASGSRSGRLLSEYGVGTVDQALLHPARAPSLRTPVGARQPGGCLRRDPCLRRLHRYAVNPSGAVVACPGLFLCSSTPATLPPAIRRRQPKSSNGDLEVEALALG